jgi:streptogramin lyase
LISNRINQIAIDVDGRKWLATSRGVSVIDGTNITSYDVEDGLYADQVNSLVIDSEGNKWFGTKNEFGHSGISKLDNLGNWSTIPESIGYAATCIAIDKVAGQLLLTPFDGKKLVGNHQLEFEVANFSQGIYFCKIKIGGQLQVLKFVKT